MSGYNNSGKESHSFSGMNVTRNNRGHANHNGSYASKNPCWHCGGFETKIFPNRARIFCRSCGVNIEHHHNEEQTTLTALNKNLEAILR